jgi:hypothetical protein
MASKTCFKCGVEKPLSEFYAHKMMADGHLNKCKACAKNDVHEHRHGKGRERVLAYDRERGGSPDRMAKNRKIAAEWRSRHPKRRSAQMILGNAVRGGRITPWPVCALPECTLKPEAHHPDYDQPLDVVWLCRAHHMQAHALVKT